MAYLLASSVWPTGEGGRRCNLTWRGWRLFGGFAGKPGVGHTPQPFLPPTQVAIGLTHAMRGAIATQAVQEHEAAHALEAYAMDPVIQLVDAPEHAGALAAVGRHLRHERQAVEPSVCVEGLQDFAEGSYLNIIPGAESKAR